MHSSHVSWCDGSCNLLKLDFFCIRAMITSVLFSLLIIGSMSGILNKNCGFTQKLAIYHIIQYYLSYCLFENLFEKKNLAV